jgi:hypothetical protein
VQAKAAGWKRCRVRDRALNEADVTDKPGYQGDAGMMLAIERGEVEGRGDVPWSAIKASSAQKLSDGRIRVILQLGINPNPELSRVPSLLALVKTPYTGRCLNCCSSRCRPACRPSAWRCYATLFVDASKDGEFLARRSVSASRSTLWTARRCKS